MRYSEIVGYSRSYNAATHPIIGHILIEAMNLKQLERHAADQTQVRVVGHDEAQSGMIVVHVACTTETALRRFESRWT